MGHGQLDNRHLEIIYEKHYSRVYNYFYYRLLNKEVTEDLTSEVFLKVIKKYHTYDKKKASIGTWINKIAENTLIDYYRAKKQELNIEDYEKYLMEDFEAQRKKLTDETNKLVYEMLATLSDQERELLYLKFYLEKSNKEIARILHLKTSTVSSRVFWIMKKLRKKFPENDAN